jgi:CDP-diglyceride synthetase
MRQLFADYMNSFYHVWLGFLGAFFHPILFLAIGYQLLDPFETNMLIDIFEVMIGYIIGTLCRARHQAQLN